MAKGFTGRQMSQEGKCHRGKRATNWWGCFKVAFVPGRQMASGKCLTKAKILSGNWSAAFGIKRQKVSSISETAFGKAASGSRPIQSGKYCFCNILLDINTLKKLIAIPISTFNILIGVYIISFLFHYYQSKMQY